MSYNLLQECHEKAKILEQHESQVLSLTTNNSRAGCRVAPSGNGSYYILCQGTAYAFFYSYFMPFYCYSFIYHRV